MCHDPEDEEYLVRTLNEVGGGAVTDSLNGNMKFFYVFIDNSFIFAVVNANLKNG